MNYPKISIITPSFNQGEFIEETILSIINQEYPNLEFIVVDGGSSDKTIEILKKYESKIEWWCSEEDAGHGDALNKGFSRSTGEIMAWLNSDDKYFPWALHTIANVFNTYPEIEWLTGQSAWLDKTGRITGIRPVLLNKYDYLAKKYQWIQQESVFWRRSLWDKSGAYIDQNVSYMVDGELWSRFFKHAKLWHLNLAFSSYRVHDTNRAIENDSEIHGEMRRIIDAFRKDQRSKISKYERFMVGLKVLSLRFTKIVDSVPMKLLFAPVFFMIRFIFFMLSLNKRLFVRMSYHLVEDNNGSLKLKNIPFGLR